MADTLFVSTGPMAVDLADGFVVAWMQGPEGQVQLAMRPADAAETARRLMRLAGEAFDEEVGLVTIAPPRGPAGLARVGFVTADGIERGFTLGLRELKGLADTAAQALAAVPPGGSG